jgi:hypothetical protein
MDRLIAIMAVCTILTLAVQNGQSVGYAQTTPAKEKEDVFKVIVTLFGVEPTTGNIVSFVTVDNMSMVKAFDAAKYYIPIKDTETRAATMAYRNATIMTTADASDVTYSSSSAKNNAGNGGLVELYYAFPNATIKNGAEFRACSIVLKDLRMVCETGVNTPALRAENIDMYLDKAQFLKVEDMKGQRTMEEDDIKAVEDAVSREGEGEEEDTTSEVVDRGEGKTEEAD